MAERTLSTGETVPLPLRTETTAFGAAFRAPLPGVRKLLPDGLEPVRATPRRGAVVALAVSYRRVGEGAVDPYDEFVVVVPARPAGATLRGVGGYVWYMPVTTESARALGAEVWGYPKVVGDVAVGTGDPLLATVDVDGRRFATLEVDRPPTVRGTVPAASYTELDGRLLRERTTLRGTVGGWPLTGNAALTIGDHPRAERLRELGVGDRALGRLYADGEFVVREGVPVE